MNDWHLIEAPNHTLIAIGNTFPIKETLKQHGFRWNPDARRWEGAPIRSAAPLWQYAKDPDLRARLQAHLSAIAESLDLSRAADAQIDVPAPEGFEYMPFQRAGIAYALKRQSTLIADEMGLGKGLSIDARVMTPTGWRRMGDLAIGDVVTSSDGASSRVIGVYPQGERRLYRVTFSDGTSVEADDPHQWTVRYRKGGRIWSELTVTTEQIRTGAKVGGITLSRTALYLPMLSAPVRFAKSEATPISPYTMGSLISNGCLAPGSTPSIAVNRLDADHVCGRIASEGFEGRRRDKSGGTVTTLSVRGVTAIIRSLGLDVLSREKRIPRVYLTASPDQRIALLQGLMDGDGSISKTRCKVTYHTISEGLARDVRELVEGLGGIASIRTYDRATEGKPVEYQIRMRLPAWVPPFSVPRKLSRYVPGSHAEPCRTVVSVEYSRDAEAVCIAVDAPDRLYVTEHCILTHNTVQACGVMNAREAKRVLIVCPASLRIVWKRHANEWLVDRLPVFMANGRKDRQFAHAVASGIAGVFIVNYDTLIEYVGIEKNPDTGRWSRKGTGPLATSTWDVLVADECHMAKNPKAQRSAALYALDATTRLALTGTPIVNRPKELFPIVNWLDRGHWGNWKHFVSRYCGAHETRFGLNTAGATNLEELQTRLRETVMVRRLKRDVLKELPAKRRQVIEVEATGDAANLVARQMMKWMQHDSAMRQAEADMRAAQEANDEQAYREAVDRMSAEYKVAFEEMARERRELAVAKVPYVIEHVDAMREAGINKIVLFAHHHEVIDKLRTHYGRSAVVIDGRVSKDDRQALVDAFQTRDDIEIFIGGIIPAGVGLTLTASAHVVFAELDWVPGNMSQAEDRCHRIGQANSVLVQHIVFTESLDAKMAKTLVDKQRVIERGLDKRDDKPTQAIERTPEPEPVIVPQVPARVPVPAALPLTGTDTDYSDVVPF